MLAPCADSGPRTRTDSTVPTYTGAILDRSEENADLSEEAGLDKDCSDNADTDCEFRFYTWWLFDDLADGWIFLMRIDESVVSASTTRPVA